MKQLDEIFVRQRELHDQASKDVIENQENAFIKFYVENDPLITPIYFVKEILEYRPITPYPLENSGHRGIINLRGNIIPIYNDDQTISEDRKRIIIFEPKPNTHFGLVGTFVKRVFIPDEEYKNVKLRHGDVITFENTPYKFFDGLEHIDLMFSNDESVQ